MTRKFILTGKHSHPAHTEGKGETRAKHDSLCRGIQQYLLTICDPPPRSVALSVCFPTLAVRPPAAGPALLCVPAQERLSLQLCEGAAAVSSCSCCSDVTSREQTH